MQLHIVSQAVLSPAECLNGCLITQQQLCLKATLLCSPEFLWNKYPKASQAT